MKQAFERYGRATVATVAALFSIAVMVVLAEATLELVHEQKESRVRAKTTPVAGTLAGWNASARSEWLPGNDDGQLGVLFAVVDTVGVGGAEFWQEIVARLRVAAPDTQLVGFCVSGGACGMPLEVDSKLIMLEAMDPALVHTLTTAARDGRVFIFRGTQIVGGMRLEADREKVARQITNFARRPTFEAGA